MIVRAPKRLHIGLCPTTEQNVPQDIILVLVLLDDEVKDISFCTSVFARPEKLDANRAMPLRESRVFLHLVRVLQDSCRKFGQRPKPYVVARYRELPSLCAPGDIDALQEAQVKRQIEFFHETCPVEAVILHLFPPQHRCRHRRSVDTHCGFANVLHQV